jgi:hypothetical protein
MRFPYLLVLLSLILTLAPTAGCSEEPPRLNEHYKEGLPRYRFASLSERLGEAYDKKVLLYDHRALDKLARLFDVARTRAFIRARFAANDDIAELSAVCSLYQLGDPLGDFDALATSRQWDNPWMLHWAVFTRFFATRLEPPKARLDAITQALARNVVSLVLRGGGRTVNDWYELMQVLSFLRVLDDAPLPASLTREILRRLTAAPAPVKDLPVFELVTIMMQRYLGGAPEPLAERLTRFLDRYWDGRSFPDEGCGDVHCATKLWIMALHAAYALNVDVGVTRATEMAAYFAALANDDGSFRADLHDPQRRGALKTLNQANCTQFCQVHLWLQLSTMHYLLDRYEIDPVAVKAKAAALRSAPPPSRP